MTLALIAGTGQLPPLLAESLVAQGKTPLICEMRGFASEVPEALPRLAFRLETLGSFLATLKAMNVTEVCMAGAMQRPEVDPAAIDEATQPLLPQLMAAMSKGDDGTLRAVIALFEAQGFAVVGAAELVPDLLPAAGWATRKPAAQSATLEADLAADLAADLGAARAALVLMGKADLGQAVLVRGGAVLAREDARGTDALLADFAVPQTAPRGQGALMFKAPKPAQDLRADMPLIGPSTAKAAAAAGLRGLIIEAGGVMVLDSPRVVTLLEERGMFLWVVE